MTTKTAEKRIRNLEKELSELRSVVFNFVPVDSEGEYKPSFIKRILKARNTKAIYKYEGKGSLMKLLTK